MTRLYRFSNDEMMDAYRTTLTDERLGWVIFSSPSSFSPAHQVRVDPKEGPVIIVGDEVFEVDPDADVYATEDEARDAYWEKKQVEQGPEKL